MSVLSTSLPTYVLITLITLLHAALHVHICQTLLCTTCEWNPWNQINAVDIVQIVQILMVTLLGYIYCGIITECVVS